MLDINVTDETPFLARLQLSKSTGAEILSTRGISILYSASAEVLAITVAVKITKYYHLPAVEEIFPLRQSETQTELVEKRSIQTQVHHRRSTVASNTDIHLLSATELQDAVANVVAQHFHCRKKSRAARSSESAPTTTQSASVPIVASKLHLGKNIVPRLQKLRVLDKMICERTALVEDFDSHFVKSEVARKRNIIIQSRITTNNLRHTQTTREPAKSNATTTPEQVTSTAELDDQFISTSMSKGDDSTEEYGESSESSDIDEAMSSSSTSTSAKSSSSSKDTVLRKNSIPDSVGRKWEIDGDWKDRLVQQKPLDIKRSGSTTQLSPTTVYLKELREKILQERLKKI